MDSASERRFSESEIEGYREKDTDGKRIQLIKTESGVYVITDDRITGTYR